MILRGKWTQVTFFMYIIIPPYTWYTGSFLTPVMMVILMLQLCWMDQFILLCISLLVTTFNVSVPKPLKMMVTNMQLIQFVCMMSQSVVLLFKGCPYPVNLTKMYLVYIMFMFLLISNFKRKAYGKKRSRNDFLKIGSWWTLVRGRKNVWSRALKLFKVIR